MALIKREAAETTYKDAIALDLADVARQAAEMKSRAEAEAKRIIAEAKEERQRLISDAAQVGEKLGRAAGHEEGLNEGREKAYDDARAEFEQDARALISAWEAALDLFESDREALLRAARQDVGDLAAVVAERVARRALQTDDATLEGVLGEMIGSLGHATSAVLRVSSADFTRAEKIIPELLARAGASIHIEIEADPTLEQGSSVVVTGDGCEVDGRLETQIERLVRAVVPEAGTGLPESRLGLTGSGEAKAGDDLEDLAA